MLLDMVSIKIAKDFPQPLIHSLMIRPAMLQLIEEGLPPLTGFFLEGGENGTVEILLDGYSMALVELDTPVVGT